MFVHQGKLEPALAARDYVDPEVFAEEQRIIFASHWHLIGAPAVLSHTGGQVALELQGTPVLVRNDEGSLVAFRNVCPHRHSLLAPLGEATHAVLRCQYHGWQFRADGNLKLLPDGPSFRGLKARDVCLERFRVERIGPLVFVNLARGGQSLRDSWGPVHDELATALEGLEPCFEQHSEHRANWKIPVENAIESYHVPIVHPQTFGDYLPERHHEHELMAQHSRYRPLAPPTLRERLAFLGFACMVPGDKCRRYQHVHVLPNTLITYSGIYVEVDQIVPLAVDRCRRDGYAFVPARLRNNLLARPLDLAHRRLLVRAAERILREDASVWESVHEGSRHSIQRGVLGAREERVYHFQSYIARQLGRLPSAGLSDSRRA